MNEEQRIKVLEEEIKILKNEIKAVLLDIREQYLNIQNPFNFNMAANLQTPKPTQDNAKNESVQKAEDLFAENNATDDLSANINSDISSDYPEITSEPDLSECVSVEDINPIIQEEKMGFGNIVEEPAIIQEEKDTQPTIELENTQQKFSSNFSKSTDIPVQYQENNIAHINNKKDAHSFNNRGKYDLVIIAGLTQWIEQATFKLGKERAEALIEIATTMGKIPEQLKDLLIKMARLSKYESTGNPVSAADYLAILTQLGNLLGNAELQENAILSILTMSRETNG